MLFIDFISCNSNKTTTETNVLSKNRTLNIIQYKKEGFTKALLLSGSKNVTNCKKNN